MKNIKKLFAFLLAAPLFLSSCIMNNGICYTHTDNNKDGICDVCGNKVKVDGESSSSGDSSASGDIAGNPCTTHVDHDLDGTCDVCGAVLSVPTHDHVDGDQDGHCDICNATMIVCNHHNDGNGDGLCDNCGAVMPTVTGDVTVYLVLSSVGLYNGKRGDTIVDKNLENTIAYIGQVGSNLPGKDVVTHSYGSATFDSWVAYDGAGAPTVYTKVPAVVNKILYAQFVPNGQAPVTPTTPTDPTIPVTTETKAYTLKTNFAEGNWSNDDAKIQVYCWDNMSNNRLYTCTKVDSDTFTFEILTSYTGCLFLRMASTTTFDPQNWDTSLLWNQSADLTIDSTKTTCQITGWNNGAGKSPVSWIA